MEAGVFAQQFLGALVLDHWRLDAHFHQLIAASSGARVEHALLAQAKYLAHFEAPNQIKASPVDRGSMIRIPIGKVKPTFCKQKSCVQKSHQF